MYSDHAPIVIDQFNGLWRNGEEDSCPPDHQPEIENFKFVGSNAIQTRDGLGIGQNISGPIGRIIRVYNFVTQDENTYLILREGGYIYHVINNGITVLGPILSIPAMTDFGFIPFAGRAYITPFTSFGVGEDRLEKGLDNEFLYVYLGTGLAARKAAGSPPTAGAITVANDGAQLSDSGDHLFGVLYETDTGFLTAPARFVLFNSNGTGFDFSVIPVSPDSFVVARRLVMTKKITNYNGDVTGYQYFFIPDGRIPNNTATVLNNITVFDADLLEDASHLIDNYAEIPAGVGLTLYHQRLCLYTTFDDISLVLVSSQGEPEAISQIDGLLIVPLDGNPVTNGFELRDVLYINKKNRTVSYVDNGDVPSSWPLTVIDQGLGCPVHGIATVVDSGSANVDYIKIATYGGIHLFNGKYIDPELSWKINDLWEEQDVTEFRRIQFVDNTVDKILYCVLPDGRLLTGNYFNGLDSRKIRWTIYRFLIRVSTVALINTKTVVIGSDGRAF